MIVIYQKEIILVNSTSTDNTFFLVNKFLSNIKIKTIKIKSISKGSIFSLYIKNLGIKNAKYDLAFLDCGIGLKKNWLINQYLLLKKKN